MSWAASALVRSVLVVGAGLAGHATAQSLRDNGFDGPITILGDEPERPYDRTPLTKQFLSGAVGRPALVLEPPEENLGAQWLLGVGAASLEVGSRTVTTTAGDRLTADVVVVASGSRARRMPGQPSGVHTVRTLADALALRAELRPGLRLVVVGAGFIGAEIASTAAALGLDVTMLEAARAPLAGPLGPAMGAAVAALHERNGVRLRCGVPVAGFVGRERVTGVELADGSTVPGDVVVVGIGAVPALDWLAGSGLDLSDGLICSSTGAAEAPGIFGVGDCSAWYDPVLGRPHRVEHWTDSRERPAVMVRQILQGAAAPPERAPYFWSDQYGVRIQFAGRRFGDEDVTIEAGSAEDASMLAVYRRGGVPVAVLGMNQMKLFTRIRRDLTRRPPPTERRHPDDALLPSVPISAKENP